MKITITKTIQLKPNQIKRLKKITLDQLQKFLIKYNCSLGLGYYNPDSVPNFTESNIIELLIISKKYSNSFSCIKITKAINDFIKELEGC